MKKLQNKVWAKVLAFVMCLAGAFGTLISILCLCLVGAEPNKSEMLDYCYDRILTNYSYEIFEEMDTSDPDWKDSLSKYDEKNWSFAVTEIRQYEEVAENSNTLDSYVYSSDDALKENYDFKNEADSLSYFQYNTKSMLGMLFGYTSEFHEEGSYTENKIRYVAMDEATGVMYAATSEGYMAIWDVCVQTQELEMRDLLNLRFEEDGTPYYVLESTGERQTAEQIRNYNYISEISQRYLDYPLHWNADVFSEVEYCESDHIYVLGSEQIKPRYYKADSSIYNYEHTGYHYITYPDVKGDYSSYVFYAKINGDLPYNDEIAQITSIINLIYGLAGSYIFLAFGCLMLFTAGLSFLIYGAGHRKDQKEITLSKIDRIPLEILTVVSGGIFIGGLFLFELLYYSNFILGDAAYIFLPALLFALVVVDIIFYLISIAVRIKKKRFCQNTIIYFLGSKIVKLCKVFWRNIPLFGKCLLFMVSIGFGEILLLLISWEFYWDFEIQIIVVCIWTFLETVLVFFFCYQMKILQKGMERVATGDLHEKVDTSHLFWEFKKHGELINKAGEGIAAAVERQMKSERFRTELITNVSHDIKTPLTSIINYVDLIQKEDIQNEKLEEYVEVLDRQSNRLKKLIEDLMEASKASTGNLPVQMENCNVSVLLTQLIGEYQEKLADRNLELMVWSPSEPVMIKADGRYLWRVFDNLMNNICKYAMEGTRVYLNMENDTMARITFRNISRQQLNISSEELMERFVRGDSSRNTEGSGLGLSIAQSLTILMNGKMELFVDGDLFKVILTFPIIPYSNPSQEQNFLTEIADIVPPETDDQQYNETD